MNRVTKMEIKDKKKEMKKEKKRDLIHPLRVPWIEFDSVSQKIRNKKTNMMVLWNGPKGQEILIKALARGELVLPTQAPWIEYDAVQGKIKNPFSNKMVNWDGDLGQSVLREALQLGPPTESDVVLDVIEIVAKHADVKTRLTMKGLNRDVKSMVPVDLNLKHMGRCFKSVILEVYNHPLAIASGISPHVSIVIGGEVRCEIQKNRYDRCVDIYVGVRKLRKAGSIPFSDLADLKDVDHLSLKKYINDTAAKQLTSIFLEMGPDSLKTYPGHTYTYEGINPVVRPFVMKSIADWIRTKGPP